MRAVVFPAIVFATAASVASAQRTQHAPSTTTGAAATRVASIAPPPAPPVSPHRFYGQGAFRYYDLPLVIMAGGRVFADFGRGFEQIVQYCGLPSAYSSGGVVLASGLQQPVVVQPTVTQPAVPGVERMPYSPQVPVQQARSEQMAAQVETLSRVSVASRSCWAVSQNGRIVVAQP